MGWGAFSAFRTGASRDRAGRAQGALGVTGRGTGFGGAFSKRVVSALGWAVLEEKGR